MAEAIHGLDDLKIKLAALGPQMEKKILTAALRQGANVIRDAARILAPRKTGELDRKINVVSARGVPGTVRFQIQATVRKVSRAYPGGFPYAAAVEEGHGAPGQRRRFYDRTSRTEFGDSQTPPHPFMRPAFDGSEDHVLETVGEQIAEGIAKFATT